MFSHSQGAMYLAHFGLDEPPFRITPHTEFFFDGAKRGATLEALIYAITHDEGIVKVTGEVGSGKTMLCRVLIERMPESIEVIYLANPSLSRDEILHVLAADLKVEADSERTTILLRALQERLIALYGEGRRVVVLIDEAHAMPPETLEEIRLLSNLESNRHKLLQIVLFGQPELDEHLGLANMRQLKERITHSFKLEPLIRADIMQYLDFRMRAAGYRGPNVFSAPALRLIAQVSEGLTRRVNILADKSLLSAFADGTHEVMARHARAAIRDSDYRKRPILFRPWAIVAAAAAGLAIGVGIQALSRSAQSPDRAQAQALSISAPTAEGSSGHLPVKPETESAPLQSGTLAHARYAATQTWLKDASAGQFTIHLFEVDAAESPALEALVRQASEVLEHEQLHVYGVKVGGRQRYAAAYGRYPSMEATITAMGTLPTFLKAHGPYPYSIARIQQHEQE